MTDMPDMPHQKYQKSCYILKEVTQSKQQTTSLCCILHEAFMQILLTWICPVPSSRKSSAVGQVKRGTLHVAARSSIFDTQSGLMTYGGSGHKQNGQPARACFPFCRWPLPSQLMSVAFPQLVSFSQLSNRRGIPKVIWRDRCREKFSHPFAQRRMVGQNPIFQDAHCKSVMGNFEKCLWRASRTFFDPTHWWVGVHWEDSFRHRVATCAKCKILVMRCGHLWWPQSVHCSGARAPSKSNNKNTPRILAEILASHPCRESLRELLRE